MSGESKPETNRCPPADSGAVRPGSVWLLAGLAAATIWSYWPVLTGMARTWADDPQYSHGYLVPAFSAYLLWARPVPAGLGGRRAPWGGLAVLAVGILLRLLGAYVSFDWLEAISLLPVLAGAVWALAGPARLRWSWPAIAYLGFMIPLPYIVETTLSHPLQGVATRASTYVLQTLGRPAYAEGNVIVVNDARIGVVEACNGLGMMLLFVAMATAVAMRVRRTAVEKALILASAVPIAVAANVLRVSVTSFLHEFVNARWADVVFHDLAGWLMMPVALGMLWVELRVLGRAFVEVKQPARRGLAGLGLPTRPDAGGSGPRPDAVPPPTHVAAARPTPATLGK